MPKRTAIPDRTAPASGAATDAGTARRWRFGSPAVKVAALAAVGCTAYSADTSWRFAADYLDMVSTAERAALFAAAELALFATALLARQNLHGPRQAPGLPGLLIWLITGVQIVPAYAESGPVGGTVRAFVGPVLAALLWHQAMGIELRLRTPQAASRSLLATLAREIRERLLSRLGIAVRDRDAAQITRDRATTQAVALAARLAERTPKQRANRRGRRLTRRLSRAIARASVGTDPEQRHQLVQQLAARRHAAALATIELPSPWTEFVRNPSAEHSGGASSDHQGESTGPESGTANGERHPERGSTAGAVVGDRPEILAGSRQDAAREHPEQAAGEPATVVPRPAGKRSGRHGPGRPPSAEVDELLGIARAAIPPAQPRHPRPDPVRRTPGRSHRQHRAGHRCQGPPDRRAQHPRSETGRVGARRATAQGRTSTRSGPALSPRSETERSAQFLSKPAALPGRSGRHSLPPGTPPHRIAPQKASSEHTSGPPEERPTYLSAGRHSRRPSGSPNRLEQDRTHSYRSRSQQY